LEKLLSMNQTSALVQQEQPILAESLPTKTAA
jgi:hypothetical protein